MNNGSSNGAQTPTFPVLEPIVDSDALDGIIATAQVIQRPVEQSLRAVQRKRLIELRASLAETRARLRNDKPQSSSFQVLNALECELDAAQVLLENPASDTNRISEALRDAHDKLDKVSFEISKHARDLSGALGAYALGLLFVSLWFGYFVWRAAKIEQIPWRFPGTYETLDDGRWLVVRAALMAIFGALIGSAVFLFRVLYNTVSGRPIDIRRLRWYFFSPAFAATLSLAIFAFVRAGLPGFGGTSSAATAGVAAAGPFAIGFLIGFAPSAVLYRITGVVKAIFGADEVATPQVGPVQVQLHDNNLAVSCIVTASPAARLISVSAQLSTTAGVTPLCELKKDVDNTWKGEAPLSAEALKDPKAASVLVEVRDDTGNVTASKPVSLMSVPQSGESDDESASVETNSPRISTAPVAGDSIAPADPLRVMFSQPLLDADPGLLRLNSDGQVAEEIEVEKKWNSTMTELSLNHAPLPLGSYRLVVDTMEDREGNDLDDTVSIDFTVKAG